MRTLSMLLIFAATGIFTACGEDTSSNGGATVTDDGGDTLGDGLLGTDDVGTSDSDVNCLCQKDYTCVPGNGGYTCVANADAVGDTGTSDITAGQLTCTEVGQCVEDACSTGAQPCGLTCSAGASADVLTKINDIATCVGQKCTNGLCKGKVTTQCMNDCTGTQCGTPLLNCFEDNTPGGNGCNSALTCLSNCDKTATTGHFTCMSKCYTGLSTLAKTQLKAFTDCLATGPGGAASLAMCQSAYTTCASGGTTGNGGCWDISKCVANCPASSATCAGDCLALGSAQAQTQTNDLNTCFATATDQSTCLGKLETCASPAGTGKCLGVQACTDACKKTFVNGDDKGSCTIGCLHAATKTSADAFIAFFACVIPNCPGCTKGDATCNACLTSKCQKELTGCTSN